MDERQPTVGGFTLERDAEGRLVLMDEAGRRHVGLEPVRAFPLSDPRHAISLCDRKGQEIVYVDALDDVPPGIREVVEAELAQREFVPVIRRILNTPPETEPTEWRVETDRGVTVFQLEKENDVHRTESGQVMLVDAHGIRYVIPDRSQLDSHSRRVLDRFL